MAETSGPWDGSGFAQDEWRELFSSVWYDGLLRSANVQTDGLQPTFSTSNREVTMSPGKALVRGNLYQSDSNIVINVPAPSGSNQRIDYIVLRYDPSEPVLDDRIAMQLVQGAEASDPTAPSLTQDHEGVWEWPRIQIGPFGTGAISGAPWEFKGGDVTPVTFRGGTDPNRRLPGLPTIRDSVVIDEEGRIWRYLNTETSPSEQYVRLGDPQTGTISLSGGWAPRPSNPPRYWVKDGLVHLGGVIDTGSVSTFQLPSGPPGTKFTSSLPSAIRPGREMSLLGFGQVARSAGTSRHRRPIGIYYDSDNRLGVMDAADPNAEGEQWMQSGGDIYLHGISWVIF